MSGEVTVEVPVNMLRHSIAKREHFFLRVQFYTGRQRLSSVQSSFPWRGIALHVSGMTRNAVKDSPRGLWDYCLAAERS